MINAYAPASADRIESLLKNHGLGEDRLEGVLQAARQFNRPGKHLRVTEEFGNRFVILPDMEGSAEKVMAKAQKLTSHVGFICLDELMYLLPGIPRDAALDFIRDVLSLRDDVVWLDEAHEWVWLKDAPRNRLVTCLSKMLTLFASTTLDNVRAGSIVTSAKETLPRRSYTRPIRFLKRFFLPGARHPVRPLASCAKQALSNLLSSLWKWKSQSHFTSLIHQKRWFAKKNLKTFLFQRWMEQHTQRSTISQSR